MSDNLEKTIRDNREAFNDKEHSDRLWANINDELSSKGNSFNWLWKVAAMLFFTTSIYLFYQNNRQEENLISQKEKISGDFTDIETYYFQIISEKRDIIYDYDTIGQQLEVDFEQDIQKLDAMYLVLKEEMKSNPSKKVVEALILNLLVRIDVLNEKIENLETEDEDNKATEQVKADEANV
jgi:hypothetical protein